MKILKYYKTFIREARQADLVTVVLFILFALFAGGATLSLIELGIKFAATSPIGFIKLLVSGLIGIPLIYLFQEFFSTDKNK